MFDLANLKALVIAPHPDDEVFGCGGLIHRIKRAGGQVYVLYLTVGDTQDFSSKGRSSQQERAKEMEKVAGFYGFDGYKIAFPGNQHHLQLDAIPQKKLIGVIERDSEISLEAVRPNLVLSPSLDDHNQDHRAVAQATISAVRPVPAKYKALQNLVLTYELPYQNWCHKGVLSFPNFFIELEKQDLQAKAAAVRFYKSQIKDTRSALSAYGVRSLAQLRGLQVGNRHAEAYEAKRILI